MKPLYTQQDFDNAKASDKLPCQCYICNKTFYKLKRVIQRTLRSQKGFSAKYCSQECNGISNKTKKVLKCNNCNKDFEKSLSQIKKTKNNFCSSSCAATHTNTHKKYGTRRSKLEIYIEEQLTLSYPTLKIDFNKKDAINSELDIYIPSLKLAFELNGIYHYEPIHGSDKLTKIQNNDQRKFQACAEKNISLCIIDSSLMKNFKKHRADIFLNIVIDIINKSKNQI